ncbi:MAG: hypothetical protein L6R39_006685 [Caloplaca ligustica]|nr:MAG: hypothetical protein L6R39_006685 [Caloplaca ligustica]
MSLPRVDTARVDVDLENINDKERYDNQGFLFSNSPEDKYGSTTSSPRAVGEAPHAEQAGTEHRQPQDEDIEERHVTERRVQLSDGQHIDQSINRLKQVKRRHATATPSSTEPEVLTAAIEGIVGDNNADFSPHHHYDEVNATTASIEAHQYVAALAVVAQDHTTTSLTPGIIVDTPSQVQPQPTPPPATKTQKLALDLLQH